MAKLVTVAMAENQTQEWMDETVAAIRGLLGADTKVILLGECNQITVTDCDPAAGG